MQAGEELGNEKEKRPRPRSEVEEGPWTLRRRPFFFFFFFLFCATIETSACRTSFLTLSIDLDLR